MREKRSRKHLLQFSCSYLRLRLVDQRPTGYLKLLIKTFGNISYIYIYINSFVLFCFFCFFQASKSQYKLNSFMFIKIKLEGSYIRRGVDNRMYIFFALICFCFGVVIVVVVVAALC